MRAIRKPVGSFSHPRFQLKSLENTNMVDAADTERVTLTVVCRQCGKRFDRPHHGSRRGSANASLIRTAAYCGEACRSAAYRARRDIAVGIPASARKRRPTKVRLTPRSPVTGASSASKQALATQTLTSVARAEIQQQNQSAPDPFRKNRARILAPAYVLDTELPPLGVSRRRRRDFTVSGGA
jgi:hypothetical protein